MFCEELHGNLYIIVVGLLKSIVEQIFIQLTHIKGDIFELHLPTTNVLLLQDIVVIVEFMSLFKLLNSFDIILLTISESEQIYGDNFSSDNEVIPKRIKLFGFDETNDVVNLKDKNINHSLQFPIIFWLSKVNDGKNE